ncbi:MULTISPECIES: M20 family metallo-hydrolase [unclassified Modicisalibacter]|uniref:M20 family metallo-hydrolase n=1 Tax=unclassified Modicisalibacter TaxID=2679913 RepID=UPI001CCBFBBC|nr:MULTISPECIES: M20 family metallo-hydrolase [unclassified Modicisalibacter]MBZ9557066.1 M20 family metallo-hydrolase [Modicisalibacter sp. R2A 31.J]MBZ9574220.1 M20 family metallo-hydrolase [Modicisalibacter sp. MOD 31.J]
MTTSSVAPLGETLIARLDEAARHSQPGPGVTRLFCSAEHRGVLTLIEAWMRRAGLSPELDAAGNLVGRCPRAQAGEKTLILGSHQDTVIEGGKYDGMLGVALPLLALEALGEAGITLPYGIEVVAFGDEEGTRFQSTLIGSRALAGGFDPASLAARDADGTSLGEALADFGGDPERIPGLARDPASVLGYCEVHIEQGPVLERRDHAVGIVTSLTGIERHRVTVTGKAGHAGTTPMAGRRDALVGAAEMVVAADRRLNATDDLVGVVGKLAVRPDAVNVIPAETTFTLELRSPHAEVRHHGREAILDDCRRLAAERDLEVTIESTYQAEAVECADWLIEALEAACEASGEPAERLFSGAGHDGLAMHALTDIGMLFVRCRDGLSHHPDEAISAADADAATRVLMTFLQALPGRLPRG